jgi:hypothetical protein
MDGMIKDLCQAHGFKSKWTAIARGLPSSRGFLSCYVTPV